MARHPGSSRTRVVCSSKTPDASVSPSVHTPLTPCLPSSGVLALYFVPAPIRVYSGQLPRIPLRKKKAEKNRSPPAPLRLQHKSPPRHNADDNPNPLIDWADVPVHGLRSSPMG